MDLLAKLSKGEAFLTWTSVDELIREVKIRD